MKLTWEYIIFVIIWARHADAHILELRASHTYPSINKNSPRTREIENAPCTLPIGAATLFLESSEQLVENYSAGSRQPISYSCPRCVSGTQWSYSPINPQSDLNDLKTKGVMQDLVIGGYRCRYYKNLCVHAEDGTRYVAATDSTVIWPVPYCKNGSCSMLLTLDPTGAVEDCKSDRVERGTDQLMDPNRFIYFNATDYNYIQINAITCGGCDNDANFCYSTTRRQQTENGMASSYNAASSDATPSRSTFATPEISLQITGYRYNSGQPLPMDAYNHVNANTVEEPYSSIGYGDNVPYIQPDGINPYDEKSGEYRFYPNQSYGPHSLQSRSASQPLTRAADWPILLRVVRNVPTRMISSGTPKTQSAHMPVNSDLVVDPEGLNQRGKHLPPGYNTDNQFQEQGTVQISQPNLLWGIRRDHNNNRSGFHVKTRQAGQNGSSSGPPGQQPTVQWMIGHPA